MSQNILNSKLNFRFQEAPKLVLSNDLETYNLNNIYPNYTPEGITFSVSNYYNEKEINTVPMIYSFETSVESPLTAKIYDENGNEVTTGISIDGDGQTSTTHNYILKILWDDSNQVEGTDYNSIEYANKKLEDIITLKALPNGENKEKYLDFELEKQFNVNIKTSPFYFITETEPDINSTYIEYSNNKAEFDVTIKNNDGSNYNINDTTYKITLEGNDKLQLYVNDEESVNNEITKVISSNSLINETLNIQLIPNDNIKLDFEEQCNIKIESIRPYSKTINYQITISRDLGINPTIETEYMTPVKYENGQWIQADTTVPGEWHDYGYRKWANVLTDNGYFVYIPRFAYKITSGYHEALETAGTMAIVFLNEDNTLKTTKDSEGNIVNPSDLITANQVDSSVENTGINATTKYIIHPAFTAFDTAEKNIEGLWVAKYEMSMETTTDGGTTWNHTSVESTTVGNVSISSSSTKRMVSKPGVSSWRYIDVTNIFDNCYYMNRNLDSHMMKNTEWGSVSYLSMSKYGKGATSAVEANKSTSYLTGYGSDGTLSTGEASTTGNMYGVFDMAGGSYEYVAGYLDDTCLNSTGTLYSSNQSLVDAEEKYKDVYEVNASGSVYSSFETNSLKVGDGLWETSDGSSEWFGNVFDFAGMSSGDHYPIFDRGGDYGSWTQNVGINYVGRNHGQNHLGVTFRSVIYVK